MDHISINAKGGASPLSTLSNQGRNNAVLCNVFLLCGVAGTIKQRGARSSKVHCSYVPFFMSLVEVLDEVRKEKRACGGPP